MQYDTRTRTGTAEERRYYSISQAAALLGVSRVSIWRWIRAGRLPAARLGDRTTRIARDDLERFLVRVGPARSAPPAGREPGARDGTDLGRAPQAGRWQTDAPRHAVQFYEGDAFLTEAAGEFIGTGLRTGDIGIVLATAAHRTSLEERLLADGLDVAAVRAAGRYVALDAAETLTRCMADGIPDPERFVEVIGGIVAHAAASGRRVRVFGELVALLAAERNHAAAVRLEAMWNDLRQAYPVMLLCAYPIASLGGEAFAEPLDAICAEHSHIIPAESYTTLPSLEDRLRTVAVLQQRARWLEAEIAERKHAEEQLRAALASERAARTAAEAALRQRDQFLSVAAHELKTPLTTLSGHAQLAVRQIIRDGHLQRERVIGALQAIAEHARKLSHLLDQALDISRLEDGRLPLQRQSVDLAALVGRVVSEAHGWSDRHVITLEAPASLKIEADPLRLEQVLTNLLDNAIRYSPDGGPIEVVLARAGPASVELSVRDHGLGIPPEKRGQIFERFYQAHAGGYRSGMGLGLYICHQIVDLHGGEIRATFPPDGGTCMIVSLPIEQSQPAPAAPGGPPGL
jgi:excisionase family DNA binding protein